MRDERDKRNVLPRLTFLPSANSRAMGGFIPLIPHIPHPPGETIGRHQGSNLLTDTQIASYYAAWGTRCAILLCRRFTRG